MELERDIDRRLAAMGVEVKPLQQMQQPAQLPASMGRNPMATKAPQIMWVGAGPAFLPPDGDYPGGSTGIDADGYLAFETLSHEPSHTSSSSSHTYINVTLKSQFTLPPPPLSHAFPSLRVPRSRAFSRAHAHALSWQHAVR
jgi:hypothetical protein